MTTVDHHVAFKFRNLEITLTTLVLHFYDDETVIPLAKIESYRLHWLLHDPIFGNKFWVLFLAVELQNGEEESGPVAFAKFNYLGEDERRRQRIERTIADALDAAIARTAMSAQKMVGI